jgi:hypothetical protein
VIRTSLVRKISSFAPINIEDVVRREIRLLSKNFSKKAITILDLGSGSGWYWNQIVKKFNHLSFRITLVDAIQIEDKANLPNAIFERKIIEVPSGLGQFKDQEFDFVVAFDLIEHLSKEDGYRLLYEVDRIAERSSVIFTPNGFVWQPPSSNNPFNAHISGWKTSELRNLGWKRIRGHTGAKKLRVPYAIPHPLISNWPISEIDAFLILLVYRVSGFAFAYSAVKRKKNSRIENQSF